MRKAITGLAVVALVAGVALVAVSLSQAPSAIAQDAEDDVFFRPLDDVLNDLVEDDVITEDQRQKIAEAFKDRMVRFGQGLRATPHLDIVAEMLDMDVEELATRLRDGSTIAEIAGDQTQAVIDALVAEQTARLDEAIAEERISEEQADEIRPAIIENVEAMVNGEKRMGIHPFGIDRFHGPRGFDFFGGPRGCFDGMPRFDRFGIGGGFGLDSIADALGLETGELLDRLADGSSPADLADEQGVEVAEIVDAVLADLDEKLRDLVADERLTQEQADDIRSNLKTMVESMVNGVIPGLDGSGFEFRFDGEFPHFRGHGGMFRFPEEFFGDLDDADGFFHFRGPGFPFPKFFEDGSP
ncbi:MAG: hypothetical protein RI637_03705, partial [Acidimicrobiia bacterium]|nr:hypothetical protein [Acidimicrobiia bacterium]